MTKRYDRVILLGASCLFLYIVLRAILLPAYYDELSTFYFHVRTGKLNPFLSDNDTNNHVLNSALTRFSYLLFGDSRLALRLPNVLAGATYLLYAWRMKRFFDSWVTAAGCFLLLTCPIYLFSFFSLCRGYGLSAAFLLGGCWHLLAYRQEFRQKDFIAGLLLLSCSLWSNLVVIIAVMAAGGIFFFLAAGEFRRHRDKKKAVRNGIFFLLFLVVPLVIAAVYSFRLNHSGALTYFNPTDEGFASAVFFSLPYELALRQPGIAEVVFYGVLALYVTAVIIQLFRRRMNGASLVAHLLFWSMLLGTILVHICWHVPYPKERTALHLYILFILALTFSLDRSWTFFRPVVFLPAAAFLLQLFQSLNVSYAPAYPCETTPVTFYEKLLEWKKLHHQAPLVTARGLQAGVIRYYDFTHRSELNDVQEQNFPGRFADFILLSGWDRVPLPGYDTVGQGPYAEILLRRKTPYPWKVMTETDRPSISSVENYILLDTLAPDSFLHRPFCCTIGFRLQAATEPFRGWIGCNICDSAGAPLVSQLTDLERLKRNYSRPERMEQRMFFDSIPQATRQIRFVFWNSGMIPVTISDVHIIAGRGAE